MVLFGKRSNILIFKLPFLKTPMKTKDNKKYIGGFKQMNKKILCFAASLMIMSSLIEYPVSGKTQLTDNTKAVIYQTTQNDVIAKGAKGDGKTDDSMYFSTTIDNYIQAGKTCALTISKFNSIKSTFRGPGRIKILGVPYLAQPSHPQGTFYPKHRWEHIIMDMNLPNEARPAGAQPRQKISGWYPFDDIRMPSDYNSINAWGQIFIKEGYSYPAASYIYIENLTLVVYRNSTKRWEVMSKTSNIGGMLFDSDYSLNGYKAPINASYVKTTNGIKVKIDKSSAGRCFHFYPLSGKRFSPIPSDIKFVIAYFDVYTDSDTSANRFVANVGADYKKNNTQIREATGGRFKNITRTKRRVYATNMDYNNYFNYCSQSIIDSLK